MSAAATETAAVASVPGVAAICNGIEHCCACAETQQEARENSEERRHVCFEGCISVEEFAGYKAAGTGTKEKHFRAEKNQQCVVNNQDNDEELPELACPELNFCPEDEGSA